MDDTQTEKTGTLTDTQKAIIAVSLIIGGIFGLLSLSEAYTNIQSQSLLGTDSNYLYFSSHSPNPYPNTYPQALAFKMHFTSTTEVCAIQVMLENIEQHYFSIAGNRIFYSAISTGSFPYTNNTYVRISATNVAIPNEAVYPDAPVFITSNYSSCVNLNSTDTYWFHIYAQNSQSDSTAITKYWNSTNTSGSYETWYLDQTGTFPYDGTGWHKNNGGFTVPNFRILNSGTGGQTPNDFENNPFPPPASVSNQDFGVLGNYIRDVFIWLFKPDSRVVNQFSTLFTSVQNKPPFGYFTAIKNEFADLASGSPTTSFGSISAISAIIDPLRTGFAWLLWLLFAVFLIKRFTGWDWHI